MSLPICHKIYRVEAASKKFQLYFNPRLTKGGGGVVATPPYGFSPVALKR